MGQKENAQRILSRRLLDWMQPIKSPHLLTIADPQQILEVKLYR